MAPILWTKSGKLAYSPSFIALAFQKDCNLAMAMDALTAATACKNLVDFGPVTSEFTRLNCVAYSTLDTQHSG